MNAIVPSGASALMPTDMRSAMDLATMMARAKLVPSHLQDKPGDCLLVIEQAMRWGMSPFAVAQSTSVISGKLMFEGKLVSAAIQSSGILSKRLNYDFDGEGTARAITVSGTIQGEDKSRTIRVTLAEAKTSNGMWTKQPDQQLVYFATRAWARRHAPEVMLGVYSPEEMEVAPRQDSFTGTTIDADAARPTTGQIINDAIPERVMDPPPKQRTVRDYVRDKLVGCTTEDEVHAIAEIPRVKKAFDEAEDAVKEELGDMMADAIAKIRENEAAANEPEEAL